MLIVRKASAVVCFTLVAIVAGSSTASAQSIMDRLKNAAKNPNTQKQPQQQQGGAAPSTGNSVTNLNGLDIYNKCMARTSGYRESMLADMLQHHLETAKNANERAKIQEDIDYLTALSKGQRAAAPDPRNSQRYLTEITDDEQVAVNTEFSRYSNAVHDYCEERYGGMSQFGDASGRRPTPKLPEPVKQAPVVTASAAPVRPRNEMANCMSARTGLQWKLMADRIEAKMGTMKGLSAADRKGWEEDVAMLRTVAENPGKGMPQSPDPNNPTRYFTRLTAEEQMALNQEYVAQSRAVMANCSGGTNTASSSALEAMHARRRGEAANAPSQAAVADSAKALAQAWLDAHPAQARKEVRPTHGLGAGDADYIERSGMQACFERGKGFRAKLMADRLATKRDSVSPQDRGELDAWISAWRAAEKARSVDTPPAPAGSSPNRDLQFLTNSDQQEINMANSIVSNKVRDECNAPNPFGTTKK